MDGDDYLTDAIATAKSLDRLECLAEVIADDKQSGYPYTTNEGYMKRLRVAWTAKWKELEGRN